MENNSCQYCSKVFKNIKYHERYCNSNPERLEFKRPNANTSEKWLKSMETRDHLNGYTKARREGTEVFSLSQESRDKISNASKGRTHSEETKQKISERRREFLAANPDKSPYLISHYTRGRSYAQQYWKDVFDTHQIQYSEEYPVGLYHLDFAIVDRKIDIEVDGEQHYSDPRIVESDKRRNAVLEEQGWTVIRIRWSEYQKTENKQEFVQCILDKIHGRLAQ